MLYSKSQKKNLIATQCCKNGRQLNILCNFTYISTQATTSKLTNRSSHNAMDPTRRVEISDIIDTVQDKTSQDNLFAPIR